MSEKGANLLSVPPLRHGDRLTRSEFERRFDATPNLKLAELIDGTVRIDPPQTFTYDGSPSFKLIGLLGIFHAHTPGTIAAARGHVRFGERDMYQPNAVLCIDPALGGAARISSDDYLEGAPELVAEIASTGASDDIVKKLQVYRSSGVCECVIWRTRDRNLDYLVLHDGRYERLAPGADGIIRSATFPGLWLAPAALVAGDAAEVLRVLHDGLKSPEHAAFVQRLAAARRP